MFSSILSQMNCMFNVKGHISENKFGLSGILEIFTCIEQNLHVCGRKNFPNPCVREHFESLSDDNLENREVSFVTPVCGWGSKQKRIGLGLIRFAYERELMITSATL